MLSHVDNHDDAVRAAQDHGSGDSSVYSSALAHVNQNQVRRTGLKFVLYIIVYAVLAL